MFSRVLFLFIATLQFSLAKVEQSYLNTNDKFFFLAKFCFRKEPANGDSGSIELKTLSEPSNPNVRYALYNDQSDSWPATYDKHGNHKSCSEITKSRGEGGQSLLILSAHDLQNGTTIRVQNDDQPRFWYLAVFDCKDGIESIRFRVHFRQNSERLFREFSLDKQGFLPQYITFFILFLLLGSVHVWGILPMYRSRSTHPLINLTSASLAMQVLSVAFYLIHYSVYAANGIGSPGTKVLAGVLDVCSQVVYVGMLLLIARGWSITNQSLEGKYVFMFVLTIFVFQYFALFVWDVAKRDQADNRYIYQTTPGLVILIVRVCVLVWFCWCLFKTFFAEVSVERRSFFKHFGMISVSWFLTLPAIAVVVVNLYSWQRENVASAMYLGFNWIFLSLISLLLWPSRLDALFQSTGPVFGEGAPNPYEDL